MAIRSTRELLCPSVQFGGEGNEAVKVIGAPLERHCILQLLVQTPGVEAYSTQPPSPASRTRMVFSATKRAPLLNGQALVGGVGHIVWAVEYCLELRLRVVKEECADLIPSAHRLVPHQGSSSQ